MTSTNASVRQQVEKHHIKALRVFLHSCDPDTTDIPCEKYLSLLTFAEIEVMIEAIEEVHAEGNLKFWRETLTPFKAAITTQLHAQAKNQRPTHRVVSTQAEFQNQGVGKLLGPKDFSGTYACNSHNLRK